MCSFELGLLLCPEKELHEVRLDDCVWCVTALKYSERERYSRHKIGGK